MSCFTHVGIEEGFPRLVGVCSVALLGQSATAEYLRAKELAGTLTASLISGRNTEAKAEFSDPLDPIPLSIA